MKHSHFMSSCIFLSSLLVNILILWSYDSIQSTWMKGSSTDFLPALYAEFMERKLNLRDFQLQESREWSLWLLDNQEVINTSWWWRGAAARLIKIYWWILHFISHSWCFRHRTHHKPKMNSTDSHLLRALPSQKWLTSYTELPQFILKTRFRYI